MNQEDMKKLEEELEILIDRNGISSVLEALAQVCFDKWQHVEVNWQDHGLARRWHKLAVKIDRLVTIADI
jgi:hypothetical protein